jgi:hypothetical protein
MSRLVMAVERILGEEGSIFQTGGSLPPGDTSAVAATRYLLGDVNLPNYAASFADAAESVHRLPRPPARSASQQTYAVDGQKASLFLSCADEDEEIGGMLAKELESPSSRSTIGSNRAGVASSFARSKIRSIRPTCSWQCYRPAILTLTGAVWNACWLFSARRNCSRSPPTRPSFMWEM